MQFSYFDLNTRSYKTISSPEIMINVLDDGSVNNQVATATPSVQKNVISGSEQFKYIKLKNHLVSMKEVDFFGSNTFYSLLFLPFLMLPLIVLFKKKKEALDSDVFGNFLCSFRKSDAQFLESQIAHRNLGYEQKQYSATLGVEKCKCPNHN